MSFTGSPGVSGLPLPPPPRLLVSVRSADEVEAAVRGGCDILDVKEPRHGPLGMADSRVLHDIARRLEELATHIPLSAALGEARDWTRENPAAELPESVSIVKAGCAGLTALELKTQLAMVRDRLALHRLTPRHHSRSLQWVAVAYADWQAARAPTPESILEIARQLEFSGLLIDTFSKGSLGLFDCLPFERLQAIRQAAARSNLWLALAGRLDLASVEPLRLLAPQIIGIRSAACENGRRDGPVSRERVARFREAITDPSCELVWGAQPGEPQTLQGR